MTAAIDTVPALTKEQARALTDDIKGRVTNLLPLVKEAFERRADQALGYATWQDYCTAELAGMRVPLGDRPAIVAELRQNGLSQRAIGAALGVSQSTVRDDLAELSTSTQLPERVVSLDGRERPATQPHRESPTVAEATEPEAAGVCEACGGPMNEGQYESGFMRCDDCDGDEAHTAHGWPNGREGGCATCDEQPEPKLVELPAHQGHADASLAAIDEAAAARAAVADAMDRFLPPDLDAPHREWRMAFLKALAPSLRLMAQFEVGAVAEHADDECVDELRRLANNINDYYERVCVARPKPDNVRHLRAVS